MKRINNTILFLFFVFSIETSFTQQLIQSLNSSNFTLLPKVKSKKSGPYFGYQRGKYDVFELGGEFQHKKIAFTHPKTFALSFGTNYSFKENVLGFDLRYWYQQARIGLTYGVYASHRTNFDESRIGIAPAIGFRLLQFHLQAGYTFYSNATNFDNYNDFFISLKFTLINNRDIDVDKKKTFNFGKNKKSKGNLFKK